METNKICCVGEAGVCPKTSSCSMVLRSACSHRHSRESSTVKEHLHASQSRKSKRNSSVSKKESNNGALSLESALESSFRKLAIQSAEKTYTLLREKFYNSFELPEATDQKLFQTSTVNLSCARELQFSQLSASDSSSVFNNVKQKECNSDYSSATESDINSSESFISTSIMSRHTPTRKSTQTRYSVRSLSGSEGEEDTNVKSTLKSGRIFHKTDSHLTNSSRSAFSGREANSQYLSNNHDSHFGSHHNHHFNNNKYSSDSSESLTHMSESSQLDRSAVEYSMFDKCRWFLWKCVYFKIIRNVSFDVWCLSRFHNYGKHKVIFFLLLPLLLLLMWGMYKHNSVSYEAFTQTLNSVTSPLYEYLSSPFSSNNYFVQKDEVVTESETVGASCSSGLSTIVTFIPSFTGVFDKISGWFVSSEESTPLDLDAEYQEEYEDKISGSVYYKKEVSESFQPTREEMKILAAEVLQDEMNSLREYIKTSIDGTEADKLKEEKKLKIEIKKLRLEFESLSGTLGKLDKDIKMQSEKSETTEKVITLNDEYKSHIDHLNVKLKTIETKLGVLEQLKSCCDKQWSPDDFIVLLEKHLVSAFKNVVDGDSDPGSKYYFFNQWLSSKFLSHEKLMQEINAALRRQSLRSENTVNYDNVIKVVESTVVKHVDSIKKNLTDMHMYGFSSYTNDMFSEDKIKKIVKEAIMLYDADKTGQVDYALESGGGSVLGTRCSETYAEKYGKISFFGVPLWTSSNSPRTAIQPDVQPGQCWAFKGSQGFLVLELSATIYPTGFTLEHIPVSLSPTGSIDSAPKNFSVWGLDSEKDSKGQLLGEYMYDITGEPLQYFEVMTPSKQPFSYVELQIHSNHGNMEYTCLYRFRVHGRRVI